MGGKDTTLSIRQVYVIEILPTGRQSVLTSTFNNLRKYRQILSGHQASVYPATRKGPFRRLLIPSKDLRMCLEVTVQDLHPHLPARQNHTLYRQHEAQFDVVPRGKWRAEVPAGQ